MPCALLHGGTPSWILYALFTLSVRDALWQFYRRNPKPFQRLCRELWPGNFRPTPAHAFFTLLHRRGKLLRCFTQNIDSLESAAGLPKTAVVAAHGNFDGAHVVGSQRPVPIEEVREAAFGGAAEWAALEGQYGGLVKPDIVFFGENLPERFFECARTDLPQATLLLIFGTSLAVHPFASLVGATQRGVPRLLINRERVGESLGLDFDGRGFASGATDDGFEQRDCDEAVRVLCELLGWQAELQTVQEGFPESRAAGAMAGAATATA